MNALTGTGQLIRLALRRDRIVLPVWLAIFPLMASSSAAATIKLYPTQESVTAAIRSSNSTAALVALYGRIHDENSLGAISMLKLTGFGAAGVAVFAMLLVVRHTRSDEETGRSELISAGVLGRHAALAAALVLTIGASLLIGVFTAFALIGAGLPTAGSFALGLSWTAAGTVFAALAALAAQLAEGARTVIGLVASVLGATYLLRAIGDASSIDGPRWLSWLSPIGWGQQIRPYASERWWVLMLPVALAGFAIVAAANLQSRRDLGAGLFRPRLGPSVASPRLGTSLALAWRLQRGSLLAWMVAFVLLGAVLGSIAGNVGALLDTENSQQLITRLGGVKNLTDAFLAAEFGIMGVIASAYAVQAGMRLRAEESADRLEPLLATAVSRTRWLFGHVIIAWAGTAVLVLGAGAAAGIARGLDTHLLGHELGRLLPAALVQLPATWVLVGIVLVVFGYWPKYAVAGWVALVAFLLLGQFGSLLGLSQWLMDLSPYGHVPRLPGADWAPVSLLALTAVAAAMTTAGAIGFRRRDIG